LDVGGDVGALVVYAPGEYLGQEIELAPNDDLSQLVHTVVRERRVGGRQLFPAVFPSLPRGRYRICFRGARAGERVTVRGGAVTETTWAGICVCDSVSPRHRVDT
jgi:hypothetical protein